VVGCGPAKTTPSSSGKTGGGKGPPVVDTDRFPHGAHTGDKPEFRNWQGRGLGCADCHDATAVKEGKVSRPGGTRVPASNQHAPCDDGQCHKKEFEKPPGPMCRICHQKVDPFTPGPEASPLQAYPERGSTHILASTFSHQLHLDKGKMENATGGHVACADCHERTAEREPEVAGHKACARCHEQQAKVKAALPMEKCAGCHPKRDVELTRGRRFITGDLRFHHAPHEKDKSGAEIPCQTCHANVDDAKTREDMAVPAMERCAQCHEDQGRTPDRVRMDQCGVCHSGNMDVGTAPASHLAGGGGGYTGVRPADHTVHFRKHHGDQAQAKDAPCRRCHTELQGNKDDTCFQCHQIMRPHDHTLMFREDHGRDAQADGRRCANCHAPEVCAGCHAVPPRSHTPLGVFRGGGHAEQARFNLSSCLTCHTYETTCVKCHRGVR
jgi:hypothetical protein